MTKFELNLAGETISASTPAIEADVVIVGGGFAGALMALLAARQGRSTIIVDPFAVYPDDFRCEKFSADQASLIASLGIINAFGLSAGSDPLALTRNGMRYDTMVNGLRGQWPESVHQRVGKAVGIVPALEGAEVLLADGARLKGRLVVLASGPGEKLRATLGMLRTVQSPGHSVTLGFDLEGAPETLEALSGRVFNGERAGDGVGYASFFPIGNLLRVNMFIYDDVRSSRVTAYRDDPVAAMKADLPRLGAEIADARLVGPVELRVTDLYRIEDAARDSVVLIGDARRTSCPASGTGISRILGDVTRLVEIYMPEWLDGDRISATDVAKFYADPELEKQDRHFLRRSVSGRETACNTSLIWRGRRALQALKRGLGQPGRASESASSRSYYTGDQVVVRSATEILGTLDADGMLEGVPFMPEMVPYIGRRMTVHKRADRTCVEGFGLRKMEGAVFLANARCDGSSHDGCQRDCLFFWKEAWLKPAAQAAETATGPKEAHARRALAAMPVSDGLDYICQSTELGQASGHLSQIHAGELIKELRTGEIDAPSFARIIYRAVVNRARRGLHLPELGLVVGVKGKKSRGSLDLQVGEWVRIRSVEEIRPTLDHTSRNLGLTFEPEMTRYVGSIHEVEKVVERMINEETGKMIGLKRTVILKGVYCQGACSKSCPRANPLFWREIWLERVAAPTTGA